MEKSVCVQCGHRGWPETLVCCYMCQDAFEHRYCFDEVSDIFKKGVKWACQDCNPTIPKETKIKENNVISPTRRSKRISLKQDQDADTTPSSRPSEKGSSLETGKKRKVSETRQKETPSESPVDVYDCDIEQNDCSTPAEENPPAKKTKKSLLEAELSMDLPKQEAASDDLIISLQKSCVQAKLTASQRAAENGSLVRNEKKKKKKKKSKASQHGDLGQNGSSRPVEANHTNKSLSMDLPLREAADADISIAPDMLQKSDVQAKPIASPSSRAAEKSKCRTRQKEKPSESLDFDQNDCSMSDEEKLPTEKTRKSFSGSESAIDIPMQETLNDDLSVPLLQKSYVQTQPVVNPSSKAAKRGSSVETGKKRKICEVSQKEKFLGSQIEVFHGKLEQKDCSTIELGKLPTKRMKKSFLGHETINDDEPLINLCSWAAEKGLPVKFDKKRKNKQNRHKVLQTEISPVHDNVEQNACSTAAEEKVLCEKSTESIVDLPLPETTNDDISIVVDPISIDTSTGHAHVSAAPLEEQTSYVESQYIMDPVGEQTSCVQAQPATSLIWIGTFSIVNDRFTKVEGVVAHLSNTACPRVREEARSLPYFLYPDIVSRSDIWPKSFRKGELNEDCIALYFIPEDSDEQVFSSLVNYMIRGDFGMKCTLENAELLVFSSVLLPLELRDFYADDFLWGVFRAKKGSG